MIAALEGPVYVSLDIDVLEPTLAPGISHPEPGGLSVREVLDVLGAIQVPVIGADVVEYNPANDLRDLTARVAAKFVKEMVGLLRSPARDVRVGPGRRGRCVAPVRKKGRVVAHPPATRPTRPTRACA